MRKITGRRHGFQLPSSICMILELASPKLTQDGSAPTA
jgi:hypothetical protein